MGLHTDGRILLASAAGLLVAILSVHAAAAQESSPRPGSGAPGRVEIERAIETVKADPNLATERTIKTLRWKSSSDNKPSRTPGWFKWIAGLFAWFEQSARVLVWCAALALAGLLVVYISRLVRSRTISERAESFVVPTHVRDLDIRPETLPEDIGAAARLLWDRGEHRASLALLYRGMLSRLAHVHGVPIRDSSTEGDCLALAASRLSQDRCEYLSRLVRVWQRFGYGREDVHAATVYVLCDDFSSALRPEPPVESIAPGSAA